MNEKGILYDEMFSMAKQLIHRDDLILKNEEEIVRLRYDIELCKLEIDQKRELVKELEHDLETKKAYYKELKADIIKLEKQADYLHQVLKAREEEIDQLEEIISDRDSSIKELEIKLGEKAKVPNRQLKKQIYKPIKGDLIDELFAKIINERECYVPLKRLSEGNYVFGTKKIQAKVTKGRLVIRLGGGYTIVEEFIDQYEEPELAKIKSLAERGDRIWEDPGYEGGVQVSPCKFSHF
jgi:hypothetical protein